MTHEDAVDQARHPERQVAIDEGLARLVVAGRVLADAVLVLERRGKLAGLLEQGGAAVHLARRLDQHVGKRRMQVVARHQLDGRRHQGELLGRQVAAQVERARRHLELAQVAEAQHVAVGLREVEQPHAFGVRAGRARWRTPPSRPSGTPRPPVLDQRLLGVLARELDEPRRVRPCPRCRSPGEAWSRRRACRCPRGRPRCACPPAPTAGRSASACDRRCRPACRRCCRASAARRSPPARRGRPARSRCPPPPSDRRAASGYRASPRRAGSSASRPGARGSCDSAPRSARSCCPRGRSSP